MREKLLRQVRENFEAKAADVARIAEGMQVFQTPHFLRVDCGSASTTFNVVVTRDLEGADLADLVRDNLEYFRNKGYPAAFWVWDSPRSSELASHLREAGLGSDEMDVAMVADLSEESRSPIESSQGFEIQSARSRPQVELFGSILAELFGSSSESRHVYGYYRRIAEQGLESFPRLGLFLGFHRGTAVSTGALFLDGRHAGIYDLATRQAYRRRGFGTALFRHLLRRAVESGCSRGILQASPDGLEIYRRAGFRPVGEVHVFENREPFIPTDKIGRRPEKS